MDNLNNYSILYAEDEGIIRLSITKRLKSYCQKVFIAKDGKEAWECYLKEQPDLLILDINMPHISGLELAKRIRKENQTIPIILLTAYTETNILLQAIELNFCKYLVKPVSKSTLKEALNSMTITVKENHKDIIKLDNTYSWNKKDEKLLQENVEIELTPRETALLNLLIRHKKQKVSHEEIMAIVWEDKFMEEISLDSIKTLMNNLRKKVPKKLIKSVYGSGYILN